MNTTQIITEEHLAHLNVTSSVFEPYINVRVYEDGRIEAEAVNEDGFYNELSRNPGKTLVHTDSITKVVAMAYIDEAGTMYRAALLLSELVREHMEHRAERTEGLYSALLRALNTNE